MLLNKNSLMKKIPIISSISIFAISCILLYFFDSSIGNFRLPVNDDVLKLRTVEFFKTILIGWSIGLSNYCLQYVTKNKFADTGVFGTYSFLQLVTMVCIILTSSKFVIYEQQLTISVIYSLVGLISGLIFFVISNNANLHSKKIIIYGIFLNTLVFSIISLILNLVNLEPDQVNANYNIYLEKLLGFISGFGSVESLIFQTIIMTICTIVIILNKHKLLALYLDNQKTRTLNINNQKFKLVIIVIIGLMTSSTYAIAGFIAFLGLAINFVTNKLFLGIKQQLPMCIVLGMLITNLCQFLCKISMYYLPVNNQALPLSAFFGIVSFPFFLISFIKK